MASAPLPITIQEFVSQNPLNTEDVLEDFGINSTPIKAAIARGHDIVFDITYSSIPISDHAQIGKNVTGVMKLKAFCDAKSIPFSFDMAKVVFGVKINFSIWLNDKTMPFSSSIEDILGLFAEQSHTVVSFVALTLAYDNIEISRSNILERAFEYQSYGLPPVRSSKSVILIRAMNTQNQSAIPSIPNFSWKAISSPSPSPAPHVAPSPIPSMVQIPEDEENVVEQNVSSAEDKSFKYQGRLRRRLFGTGPPPVSVDATYNGKPNGKQPYGWVQSFAKFWSNGEAGIEINGEKVKIPENDRFRRFTGFALKFHPRVIGKKVNDPEVISFMQEELGSHFPAWNKYDWSKIVLNQPFPENPPMKS